MRLVLRLWGLLVDGGCAEHELGDGGSAEYDTDGSSVRKRAARLSRVPTEVPFEPCAARDWCLFLQVLVALHPPRSRGRSVAFGHDCAEAVDGRLVTSAAASRAATDGR